MSAGENVRNWAGAAWTPGLCCAVCLAGGADQALPALTLSAVSALGLLGVLAWAPSQTRVPGATSLPVIALSFALVIGAGIWAMTPWAPGGPHPVWAYTTAFGAVAVDRARALTEIFKLLGLACLFCVGLLYGTSDRQAKRTLYSLLAFGALYAIAALARPVHPNWQFGVRTTGGLPSPNIAAVLFAALSLTSLPLFFRSYASGGHSGLERAIIRFAPGVGLLLLFTTGLVMTASRSATFALAISLTAFVVLQVISGRLGWGRAALSLAALLGLFGLLVLAKGTATVQHIGEGLTDANGRIPLYTHHWTVFTASPLLGYGLGSFDAMNKLTMDANVYPILRNVRAAHSVYLQWLESGGALGAAAMFACLAVTIGTTLLGMWGRTRSRSWLAALLAVDLLFICHGASDFALEVPAVAAIWALLLGLQLGMVAPPSSSGN